MDLETGLTYGPRRAVRGLLVIGLLTLVALLAADAWRKHAINPDLATALAVLTLSAVFNLVALVKGVPRLVIDRQGISLRTWRRTDAFYWANLGGISVVQGKGRRSGKVLSATVRIIGLHPDQSRTSFTIPNGFRVPLDTILEQIASWHASAGIQTAWRTSPAIERPIGVVGFRFPWLTALMMAVFVAVFVIEQRFPVRPATRLLQPSIDTRVAPGGVSRQLALHGEWYRLITAPFLHANLLHLIGNLTAFAFAGYALERVVGRAWMFCIFAAGALAGAVATLLWSPAATIGVGASGGIMAMLAALFVISFRLPPGRAKIFVQYMALRTAIPALIPLYANIGYAAHFGGAIFGAILGLLLLKTWEDNAPLPCLRAAAAGLAAMAVLSYATSAGAVVRHFPLYDLHDWIPAAEYPKNATEAAARADHFLLTYPRDPSSHYFAGMARLAQGDKERAEMHFRASIKVAEAAPLPQGPRLAGNMRIMLAKTVLDEGRVQEARTIAAPVCAAAAPPSSVFQSLLQKSGLCQPATQR